MSRIGVCSADLRPSRRRGCFRSDFSPIEDNKRSHFQLKVSVQGRSPDVPFDLSTSSRLIGSVTVQPRPRPDGTRHDRGRTCGGLVSRLPLKRVVVLVLVCVLRSRYESLAVELSRVDFWGYAFRKKNLHN
ncbi:hypothetical protein MRX96_035021 [Rhipicephalus microplus]